MNHFFSRAVAYVAACLKQLRLAQVLSVVLAGYLFLATANYQQDQSLGERIRDRIDQAEQNSGRPKTTGEFQDEIRRGVPVGKRLKNTVRDSAEAFDQFGKNYSVGAQETARNVKGKAAQAGKDASKGVERAADRASNAIRD